MTFKRIGATEPASSDRRSGMNRRWIKTPYHGVERRSGGDRRGESSPLEASEPNRSVAERTESLEKLLFSTTVRLEALARLLVEKGLLSPRELSEMLIAMQAEYQQPELKHNR